ncbi:MAG: 6-phosphogluconolactonase [Rikenellaceae bacterium]
MKSNYKLQTGGGLIVGAEPIDIVTRFEMIPTEIVPSSSEGSSKVANEIVALIQEKAAKGKKCVIGLSTGKSPLPVYDELVRLHKEEGVSFKNVVVFTLDEFYPVKSDDVHSRNYNLRTVFLNHVDILEENINIMEGSTSIDSISCYCKSYEKSIEDAGGLDMMVLGIGLSAQIGFNEPGTHNNSKTRLIALANRTRMSLSSLFVTGVDVPSSAITLGISTIMNAKRVIVFAWSEEKAQAVADMVEKEISNATPASHLQNHPNCKIIVSEDAASELTRSKSPWLVGTCEWTPKFIRKAVLWLCQKVDKPILKLTHEDYINNSLSDLLDKKGSYSDINIKIFNDLQHTISGWPGGKPNSDDTTRPERSNPFPKKVVVFSPHPDDDVISMGGTFIRLTDQGHDVHVAYETSGNIAVHDDVVLQHFDTAREVGFTDRYDEVKALVKSKQDDGFEPEALRQIKGSIRRAEAKAACRSFGLNEETNAHFLNLPFYETGTIEKKGLGPEDVEIVAKFLDELKPHQIYAAGDLTDPHGTHRVCIEAVLGGIELLKSQNAEWLKDCRLWLYRGAWQEWELDMVDMAVPLSPREVIRKRHAIYHHLSQKDIVPFPGDDKREFWERAEDRTQATAALYDKLGMAEYEAIEVFVRYEF